MLTIDTSAIETKDLFAYLTGAVGPRPIALAATIDANGNHNLSPFSFFNVFSANPPILVFSPSRRVRDNTTKHTLENVKEVKEVVINVVNYEMVQQTSLSSTEYGKGVNEFVKSGLTPIPSLTVQPMRVKESPVQMECFVKDIIELGDQGGAGNMVVCEIKKIHVSRDILDSNDKIDPDKIDLVGRMGADWYCRASGNAIFEVEKPLTTKGIGIDQIPPRIRNSYILTGNDLGRLGNVEVLPSESAIKQHADNREILDIIRNSVDDNERREKLHSLAKEQIEANKIQEAWKTLLVR